MSNKNKKQGNIVYSTNPNFNFINEDSSDVISTIPSKQQNLTVLLDKKARAGKSVTLVKGFIGKEEDLLDLGKYLKTKCGVGGSVKDNEILIQGDFRQKIKLLLEEKEFKVKIAGL